MHKERTTHHFYDDERNRTGRRHCYETVTDRAGSGDEGVMRVAHPRVVLRYRQNMGKLKFFLHKTVFFKLRMTVKEKAH